MRAHILLSQRLFWCLLKEASGFPFALLFIKGYIDRQLEFPKLDHVVTNSSHSSPFVSIFMVHLLILYTTQELIIKGLANSRTFQRFALKVEENTKHLHGTLEELSKQAEKAAAAAAAQASGEARTAAGAARYGPPQPPLRGVPGFFVAFFKEIGRDLGMVKT